MKKDSSITITTTHIIPYDMINDLIITAFEGGINYWCYKVRIKEYPPGMYPESEEAKKMMASEVLASGGLVMLFDAESDDKWVLTKDEIIKGIKMHCEDRKITPEALYDNYDAEDADCIVQYALFDELTFS